MTVRTPACLVLPTIPLQCSPGEPPLPCSRGSLQGHRAHDRRRGPGCWMLLAPRTASSGLDRWLDSTELLGTGWPPGLGLSLGGPPGAPLARMVPLRGRQARERSIRLPEQTVHLGCSSYGVAAHGAPQPIRIPASWFVSHGVPLGMTCPQQESQGEWQ